MTKMLRKLVAISICSLISIYSTAQTCDRSPRDVIYQNKVVNVYVSPDQQAQIVFPSPIIVSVEKENPDGLEITSTSIKNKISITTSRDDYSGIVTFDGSDGESYLIQLLARPGCGDKFVNLERRSIQNKADYKRNKDGSIKPLIWYLVTGSTPPSDYWKTDFSGMSADERIVVQQGSLEISILEMWEGSRFTGSIYSIENKGRTPYRVGIEKMNYGDKGIIEALGKVRQIAMLPENQRLGPSPEFLSEVYADSHRGLLFVVSEREDSY